MAPLSFDARLQRAQSPSPADAQGRFDGRATISVAEASELGDAIWEAPSADRAAAIAAARNLISNPQSFGSFSALAALQRDVNRATATPNWQARQQEITYERIAAQASTDFSAILPGKLMVLRLAGNAGRPVAVYVPPGFDPARPAKMVTYFHGINTEIGPTLASSSNGLISRIKQLGAQENAIYVIPQGDPNSGSPWPAREMSLAGMETQALDVATQLVGSPITIGSRTVIAHSGGGKAVSLAAARGDLQADKLVLLDCFYGDWADAIGTWVHDTGQTQPITVDYYRSSNVPNDKRLGDGFFKAIAGAPFVTANRHTESSVHAALPGHFSAP